MRFRRLSWFVLAWNLLVIAVGTVVRATKSGAGCGADWPVCRGQVVPLSPTLETIREYTHRMVSGVDGILVLALLIFAIVLYRKNDRRVVIAAVLSFVLTLVEAFIGAVLVKRGYVVDNKSVGRAVTMGLHLVSTFALLSALTMTAWFATYKERLTIKHQGAFGFALGVAFIGLLGLGISGAITALGDTLFPAVSHEDALEQARTGTHFLQQLRLQHPLIAGTMGLYLLLIAGLATHLRPSGPTRRGAEMLTWVFIAQMGMGFINVSLKAPVFMQIIHLLMADFTWIALIFLTCAAFLTTTPRIETIAQSAIERDTVFVAPTWKDYLALTKPRVISLLLLTTITATFMAARGWPGFWLFLTVTVGGYLSAGAANAINMVIDRDIDHKMERTAKRPTVTASIPAPKALAFGLFLMFASFAMLWIGANLLTALLALGGLVFYVIIYTLILKRRTWHNIVIGGAAGAFPPLVGWAAVTGQLAPLAWILFGIVFVWTPAHFWALSLLIKEDYRKVGVPMAPLVIGDKATIIQIGIYAVLTVLLSLVPYFQGMVGIFYLGVAILIGGDFIRRCLLLLKNTERKFASSAFHASMVYLAVLFVTLAIDRSVTGRYAFFSVLPLVLTLTIERIVVMRQKATLVRVN
jgi:heme o synthase